MVGFENVKREKMLKKETRDLERNRERKKEIERVWERKGEREKKERIERIERKRGEKEKIEKTK